MPRLFEECDQCGGSGFDTPGTGYDNVCGKCGGLRFLPVKAPAGKPAGCDPCSWPACGCQYSPPRIVEPKTEAELDAVLNSEDTRPCTVLPDGKVVYPTEDICECPKCGRNHRKLGSPPWVSRLSAGSWGTAEFQAEISRLKELGIAKDDEIHRLRSALPQEVREIQNAGNGAAASDYSDQDVRWGVNYLLEQIAAKFEAWDTFDLFRSEAAATVRGFKHDLSSSVTRPQSECK